MATHIDPVALRRQIFFWLIALAVFVGFLMVFSSILLPFIAGMALAYFLDPVADWFERRGLSRLKATLVILISFVAIFALSLIVVVPILVTQAVDLGGRIPGYITELQALLVSETTLLPDWVGSQMGQIKESFAGLLKEGAGFVGTIFQQIWNSGMAILDIAALFVVTPVVAFYLLLDWDKMIEKVDNWVPRDHVGTVRELARQIDQAIAGFVRGQGSVCLILGVIYAVGLMVIGLNFGLLIGLFAGVISFIPYVGSLVGLVLALIVAIVQFWPDFIMIGAVIGVFVVGQFFEGNILQPRMVGSSVGLHPVWLMFALFAFGVLFGFVGMMIAVPAAAAIGVLVRFAINRYLESDLYSGHRGPEIRDPLPPGGAPPDQ
ncbi:MAG: AI-2E family transporter [Hoeflea sp.]|uniref:AI-2E family transporter n=1 Tax=Hoeflea sp. TaxID=1940281 RepID=UPI001D9E96CD|nr:AI-2E family transporter [Hoeflea sp.]MBU4530071.1 AI-2E family transporter [Alphaproteobacteria bacterium]MBU4542644.1 AI-2E family transporter [Alphaproteobacteria bacterium]MBU4551325.1 AI-2E family transporter [Alphaproteobacteria bacterium]MBV1723148.1 AI-2E family transporter [Hoeflea sp.]MBV1760159.1 AI-2E family transporter [Hoeflea sp.]